MEVDEGAVLLGAHPHGYLLLTGAAQDDIPPECAGWPRRTDLVPGSTLLVQPRTVVGHARGARSDRAVVLLGHPVDVARGITDPTVIAAHLADTWTRSGTGALVTEAADLGGRWTLVAGRTAPTGSVAPEPGPRPGEPTTVELVVVPDTHASQPVHVGRTARRAAVASAPSLVAATLGLGVDERALELLDLLRRRMAGRVSYLPGRRTAYLGVEAVLPNFSLRLTLGPDGPQVRHERFWPFRPRVERHDLDEVYAAFRDRLDDHTALLATLGRPAVSLTGGLDSRVTAAVAAPVLRERGGFAFTYLNPRDATRGWAAVDDVTGAREVARGLGLAHRVLRWRQPPRGGTFDVLHRRTYAPLVPSRGAAHAMWADLPPDLVQLQSNGGETGTAFIEDRPEHELSPRWLTQVFSRDEDGLADLVEELYGDYLDVVPMDPAALRGFEPHDVHYWEQRMGRWGWQKFTDGDLGHRILLPFNDRVLLETMLSLPFPLRRDRVLFHRLLEEARVPAPRSRGEETATAAGAPDPLAPILRLLPSRLHEPVRRVTRRTLGQEGDEGADRPDEGRVDSGTAGVGAGRSDFSLRPASAHAASPTLPGHQEVALPGGLLVLQVHPELAHAVVGDATCWVLVLGEPCDVPDARDGATAVAPLLHRELADGRGLEAAADRAAALTGSWTVLLSGPDGARVLTDPLATPALRLEPDASTLIGGGAADREPGAEGRAPGERLGGTRWARAAGPAGSGPWEVADLPQLTGHVLEPGVDAQTRLLQHVRLLARRGPVVLGLGSAGSLLRLAPLLGEVEVLTCWDPSSTRSTRAMIAAGDRALAAGQDQRLVVVDGEVPAELDAALAEDAVLWLGCRPDGGAGSRRLVEAARAVRPVALPWSDRVLDRLL